MDFIDKTLAAVSHCFGQYFKFSGRSKRSDYWYWLLFNVIMMLVLAPIGFFSDIFYLIVFLPNVTVIVRRLHDIGRSGWWICITPIPIIGIFTILYWMSRPSMAGENKYGMPPETTA